MAILAGWIKVLAISILFCFNTGWKEKKNKQRKNIWETSEHLILKKGVALHMINFEFP